MIILFLFVAAAGAHSLFWVLAFWLIMLFALVFGFVTRAPGYAGYYPFVFWVLLAILGYLTIGFPG